MHSWDAEVDVVVVGSGAAGLTAAMLAHDHGADVIVLERSGTVGGTTAVSGGGLWIPLNHHMADVGARDSREEALTYCKRLTASRAPDELVETFVDTGHRMVRYLEQHTPLEFEAWPLPDYQPGVEGAKMGGRSIEPSIFNRNELGEWRTRLRPSPIYLLPLSLQELIFKYQAHIRPHDIPSDMVVRRMEQGIIACGNALVARMLKGCIERGISIRLEARATDLVREDRRVTGLRATSKGKDLLVRARGGVVLASGGFEWNERLKAQFLPGPVTHPNTPPVNEGDGLVMAADVGAALGNMTEVWGSPAAQVPGEDYDGRPLSRLAVPERMCPHAILVNRRGKRFVSEGAPYNDMAKAFNEFDPTTYEYRNVPCWAIFDAQYRERYPVLTVLPGDAEPEWLAREQTLEALAGLAGIDPAGLASTVAHWNASVGEGMDADFGRHRYPVDFSAPHPSMGTIERPPFYALPIYPGTLGTKGGPATNANGEVLNARGDRIPGLYAAGNVMASVAGQGYYGGGATIGLAMTWGYICGINSAAQARTNAA